MPVQRRSKDTALPAADEIIEGTIVGSGILKPEVDKVGDLTPHEQARVLTDRIRQGLKDIVALRKLIIEAFTSRAWETLGYGSWQAYCDSEFRVISLGRAHQAALNAALQLEAGMSARAAAAATGTDHKTATRDADRATGEDSPVGSGRPQGRPPARRTGADGKSRPATRTRPEKHVAPPQPRMQAEPPVSLLIRFRNARKQLQAIAKDLGEHGIPEGDPPGALGAELDACREYLDQVEAALARPAEALDPDGAEVVDLSAKFLGRRTRA